MAGAGGPQDDTGSVGPGQAWWSTKRAWQVAALGLTVAASCWWLLAPVYQPQSTCSGGGSSSGASWSTCDPPTTLLAAGAWGYVVSFAVVPVLLAALALVGRGRAWSTLSIVSAAGLGALVVLGGLSFGLPFLPGAVCAVVGAALRPRPREGSTPSGEVAARA